MSDTLPEAIEQAIGRVILTSAELGELPQRKRPGSTEGAAAITAEVQLREAIAQETASLRQRAERLRLWIVAEQSTWGFDKSIEDRMAAAEAVSAAWENLRWDTDLAADLIPTQAGDVVDLA